MPRRAFGHRLARVAVATVFVPAVAHAEDNSPPQVNDSIVSVGYRAKEGVAWSCRGALISPTRVVTAAHCVGSRTLQASGNVIRQARPGFGLPRQILVRPEVCSGRPECAEPVRADVVARAHATIDGDVAHLELADPLSAPSATVGLASQTRGDWWVVPKAKAPPHAAPVRVRPICGGGRCPRETASVLGPSDWLLAAHAEFGDSGTPAFDSAGRVIAVLSRGNTAGKYVVFSGLSATSSSPSVAETNVSARDLAASGQARLGDSPGLSSGGNASKGTPPEMSGGCGCCTVSSTPAASSLSVLAVALFGAAWLVRSRRTP